MFTIFLVNKKEKLEFDEPVTISEIISKYGDLKSNFLDGQFNGISFSKNQPMNETGKLEIVTVNSKTAFSMLNHLFSHVLEEALKKIYKNVQVGICKTLEEGFYCDVKTKQSISTDDFSKISSSMREILTSNFSIRCDRKSKNEALNLFKDNSFKQQIINDVKQKTVFPIVYINDNIVDLCFENHISNVSKIQNFKLLTSSGAYWKNNSNNPIMTRITGIAFFESKKMREYLKLLELKKQRDHRVIGKKLKIFYIDHEYAPGFPNWLPNGVTIIREISNYLHQMEKKYNYEHVITPILGNEKMYQISGHLEHYRNDMFPPIKTDHDNFILRPMSCPHHCRIYNSEKRSYRDLPIKYAEDAILHRYEASGALSGLERVRMMTLTDAHIFARRDQVEELVLECIKNIQEVLKVFKFKIDYFRLSLGDKKDDKSFVKNDALWSETEEILEKIMQNSKINYTKEIGEAAFYGPKIDVQCKTVLNHDITISTIQLDFSTPLNFDLVFNNKNNETEHPIIIHRGLIGTYERFIASLLEQTSGVLPFWLSPQQVKIICVEDSNEEQQKYAKKIKLILIKNDIRTTVDLSNNRFGNKIRNAQVEKIPFQIIIGNSEIETNKISYRMYGKKETHSSSIEQFIKLLKKRIEEK